MSAFEQPDAPICRTASVSDLDAIHSLEVAEFGHLAYPYFVLQQLFELSGANWTVAEESGQVCGYVLATIDSKRSAWFLGFAVAAEYRSCGYGRVLLEAALTQCRHGQVDQVFITVRPTDRPGRRLCKEVGFVWTDHEAAYFGPDEPRDILVYRLRR